MAEVRWTSQAADDLEAIADFIAADSPQYARLFAMDATAARGTPRRTEYP